MPEYEVDLMAALADADQRAQAMAALMLREIDKYLLTITKAMNDIGDMVLDRWADLAQSKSPWGGRYASTLKVIQMAPNNTGGTVTVYSDESHKNYMFVKMMEKGVKPWSIKEKLLASKAAKKNYISGKMFGKPISGKLFVVVPFRLRTPPSEPIKATSAAFTGTMEKKVHDILKSGGRITGKQAREFGDKNLAGLSKQAGGAFTFRMVTEKSKGWYHKGKPPTPVFDDIVAELGTITEAIMLETLAELTMAGKKLSK